MYYRILIITALALLTACRQPSGNKGQNTDTVQNTANADTIKAIFPDKLINPGKNIGRTYLNEDLKDVIKRLGKPDTGDAATGKSVSVWYTDHDSKTHQVSIFASRQMGTSDERAKVKMIRITSPWFITADGIETGMTKKAIETRYQLKKVELSISGGQAYAPIKQNMGIAFEFDQQKICNAIIVYGEKKL